ncbi:MAG: hypothetical protein SWC96_00205 [Thermodesulfobacteriota bacterium]|nr:hypothetical protein [Thermodesulfobacteriota bacterium]
MTETINRQVHLLIQNGRHCILAIANNNRPYCSLTAYVAAPDGTGAPTRPGACGRSPAVHVPMTAVLKGMIR